VSRLITRHYGIAEVDIDAEANHPLKDYPQYGPDRDEPFIGIYQAVIEASLQAAAADGVRLMLGGDRGDLLVGGFNIALTNLLMTGHFRGLAAEVDRLARLTNRSRLAVAYDFVLRPGAGIARRLGVGGVMRKLRSGFRHTDREVSDFPPWVPPEMVEHAQAIGRDALPPPAIEDPWKRRRLEYILEPMHMRGVAWSERTYARFGIGFADPFSDVRLAQFVLAIPQVVLNRPGRVDKRLLRLAMAGTMPEEALRLARKVSPHPLWDRSLRDWESHTVTGLLTDMQAAARGFVDERELNRHSRNIQAGGRPRPELWWALSLEMWLRTYWS
jgi:asparagine synthase (glutamine-hydrolysing)